MSDAAEERIWCVRRYPDGGLLRTDLSYEACAAWQQANDRCTFIAPAFFQRMEP